MYLKRTPVENFEVETEEGPVVTQELVATQTAVSHTVTVDDHFSLDGAILFPFDSAVLSDDGTAIIDERTVKYRGKSKICSISTLLAMQTASAQKSTKGLVGRTRASCGRLHRYSG